MDMESSLLVFHKKGILISGSSLPGFLSAVPFCQYIFIYIYIHKLAFLDDGQPWLQLCLGRYYKGLPNLNNR
jgi:hypothetical protein